MCVREREREGVNECVSVCVYVCVCMCVCVCVWVGVWVCHLVDRLHVFWKKKNTNGTSVNNVHICVY